MLEAIERYIAITGGFGVCVAAMLFLPVEKAMTLCMLIIPACFALAGTGKGEKK